MHELRYRRIQSIRKPGLGGVLNLRHMLRRDRPGILGAVSGADPYRDLPSVDALASRIDTPLPRPLVVDAVRAAIEEARAGAAEGRAVDAAALAGRLTRAMERSGGAPLINATGVLLHTNVGRARWSERAVRRAAETARNATSLEIDVDTGRRSRRGEYVSSLLTALTGAEDALVVNNNASAVLLALSALASGRAVPVARGELIEIGGSYRLPEVMEASGARLVEVGTTNRTRAGDFAVAAQIHRCGAMLVVHPSNYRVEGFTESASIEELSDAAREAGVPLIYDIGSGLLDAETPWISGPTPSWLRGEPGARQALEAGADLAAFSGDKLLGGPQAGVVVGGAEIIGALKSNPLARALRADGVTYAALAATLEAYLEGSIDEIPFWRQALTDADALAERAAALAGRIGAAVTEGASTIGAGSAPGAAIPGPLLVLDGEDRLYEALLGADVPVLTRREGGAAVIDLRTVDPEHDELVGETVLQCR